MQSKLTVTLLLFQPAWLGRGLAEEVIVGSVKSMLRVTLAEAEFPAALKAQRFHDGKGHVGR